MGENVATSIAPMQCARADYLMQNVSNSVRWRTDFARSWSEKTNGLPAIPRDPRRPARGERLPNPPVPGGRSLGKHDMPRITHALRRDEFGFLTRRAAKPANTTPSFWAAGAMILSWLGACALALALGFGWVG